MYKRQENNVQKPTQNSVYSLFVSMTMCHRFRVLVWMKCKNKLLFQLNLFVLQEILLDEIFRESDKGKLNMHSFCLFFFLTVSHHASQIHNEYHKTVFFNITIFEWIQFKKIFEV